MEILEESWPGHLIANTVQTQNLRASVKDFAQKRGGCFVASGPCEQYCVDEEPAMPLQVAEETCELLTLEVVC